MEPHVSPVGLGLDSHRLVVFVFVKIGFEGLDSKGPQRLSDRDMVTMWSWPVPPTFRVSL